MVLFSRSSSCQLAFLVLAWFVAPLPAAVAEEAALTLTLHDHRFTPNPLEVPAGVRQLILIDNQDSSAEEFESESMHREKLLHAKTVTRLYVGPLKPGRYEYFGDFHEGQAKGVVIAK